MSATLIDMPKKQTEQVRLPVDMMNRVRMACGAFGEAPNEYVARAVNELLKREMAKAAKIVAKAAEQSGNQSGQSQED